MDDQRPSSAGARARIEAFLAAHTTLALASVGPDGSPHAAAVFYAHDADLRLYFLSEERSRHGADLSAVAAVAGAIYDDGQDWRTIQGVQVHGNAQPVPDRQLAHAAAVYARKYAFIGALLAGGNGPAALVGPLARARFWVLLPSWFRLTDNRVRFGFKEELWVADGLTA